MALVFSITNHNILGYIPEAYLVEDSNGYVARQVYAHHFHDEEFVKKNDTMVACFNLLGKTEVKYYFEQLGIPPNKYPQFSQKEKNKPQIDYHLLLIKERLCQFLKIISDNQLPFAYNITRDAPVKLLNHTSNVALDLYFNGIDQNIDYQLKLSINNKNINLRTCPLTIIHSKPAWCIIDNYLVHLPEIKASFLKPFQTKNSISINQDKFDSYLKKIVAPLMESSKISIHTQGIPVNEVNTPTKTSFTIETHFQKQKWVVYPQHHYGKKSFPAGKSPKKITSTIEIKNEQSEIQQIIRNWKVEEDHLRDIIEDANLTNSYFQLPVDNLHDVQTWIERKIKDLPDHVRFAGWYYLGKLVNTEKSQLTISVLNQTSDWFDIEVVINVGNISVPFKDLAKTILEGKDVHLLENGEYFIIPTAWKSKVDFIDKHAVKSETSLKLPALKQHILGDDIPEREAIKDVEIVQPEKFSYRTYQQAAIQKMLEAAKHQHGFLLADEMGLGKTLQVLGILASLHQAGIVGKPSTQSIPKAGSQLSLFDDLSTPASKVLPALVVVPPALMINWHRESQRFFPHLHALVYSGPNRHTNDLTHYDLIISSYHTVREDAEIFESIPFSLMALDEAHYIKNPQSQIYEAVKSINCDFRIALTGTPIENNLKDLWSIFSVIEPKLLGNYKAFNHDYRLPIESEKNEFSLDQLKHLLSPFMLRRTKRLVGQDLPELLEHVVFSEMTANQNELYEETKSKVRNAIMEGQLNASETNLNIHILNGLTKLRQISNHPKLVNESIESGKFEQIISDIIQIHDSQKRVLVFSTFTTYLDLIKCELAGSSIKCLMYTGSLNTNERQRIIDKFSTSNDSSVLLMSLKAGGVGLNLTKADYVLIADPWWNPQAENQAIARAHRIGRTEAVTVKKYISIGTIEEKIHQLQQKKIELSEEILAVAQENHSVKISSQAILELI